MRFIFAMLAMAAFAASPAMAQDGGFYVGAGIGQFNLEFDGFDGGDVGFKVLGGYQFGRYFGAELEYIDGGEPDDFGIDVDVSGFNLSVLGILPVGEQFNVFAKLGMLAWDVSAPDFGDDSGEDFSWGIGGSWLFTENFGARLEYQGFEIDDTDTVDMISIGMTYTF